MKTLYVFILLVALSVQSTFAWSGPGHMIIAAEAYRQLSPGSQEWVAEVLKSHPDYAKWLAANKSEGVDVPLYIFMRASTWPDEIRRGGGPDRKYNHSHWHYIDYPIEPPSFPMKPGPSPNDDVLYGVERCEKILKAKTTSPNDKAVYLSYLIHLVGDMHQPLHCSSLVSSTYPNGDKGGNDFYVMPASRGIKLHALWDGLLGTRIHPRTQLDEAIRIGAEHPAKSLLELEKDKTPKSWSLESRELAIDKAYLRGKLQGGTSADTAPPLPSGYTADAKVVAEKQAALAGYRLAGFIEAVVK